MCPVREFFKQEKRWQYVYSSFVSEQAAENPVKYIRGFMCKSGMKKALRDHFLAAPTSGDDLSELV
jgi:hypothetical protein